MQYSPLPTGIEPDWEEEWRQLKQILLDHCAAIGRDPDEIECSVNVMIPPSGELTEAVTTVAAYHDAGVDLVVMNLPHGAPTALLGDLAQTLAAL